MSAVRPHSKPPNYSKYKMGSLLNNQIQGLFCIKSKAFRLMLGRWYRESCWNGKRKQNMRNMHGVGFPNATYWVCTQTGTNADLRREPSPLVQRNAFDQTHGAFLPKAEHYMRSKGFTLRCSLYRHQSPFQERVSTTHHNLYPQFGVQSRNVNSSMFCLSVLLRPSVRHCRSLSSRYLYSKVNPSFFLWPHFS